MPSRVLLLARHTAACAPVAQRLASTATAQRSRCTVPPAALQGVLQELRDLLQACSLLSADLHSTEGGSHSTPSEPVIAARQNRQDKENKQSPLDTPWPADQAEAVLSALDTLHLACRVSRDAPQVSPLGELLQPLHRQRLSLFRAVASAPGGSPAARLLVRAAERHGRPARGGPAAAAASPHILNKPAFLGSLRGALPPGSQAAQGHPNEALLRSTEAALLLRSAVLHCEEARGRLAATPPLQVLAGAARFGFRGSLLSAAVPPLLRLLLMPRRGAGGGGGGAPPPALRQVLVEVLPPALPGLVASHAAAPPDLVAALLACGGGEAFAREWCIPALSVFAAVVDPSLASPAAKQLRLATHHALQQVRQAVESGQGPSGRGEVAGVGFPAFTHLYRVATKGCFAESLAVLAHLSQSRAAVLRAWFDASVSGARGARHGTLLLPAEAVVGYELALGGGVLLGLAEGALAEGHPAAVGAMPDAMLVRLAEAFAEGGEATRRLFDLIEASFSWEGGGRGGGEAMRLGEAFAKSRVAMHVPFFRALRGSLSPGAQVPPLVDMQFKACMV